MSMFEGAVSNIFGDYCVEIQFLLFFFQILASNFHKLWGNRVVSQCNPQILNYQLLVSYQIRLSLFADQIPQVQRGHGHGADGR